MHSGSCPVATGQWSLYKQTNVILQDDICHCIRCPPVSKETKNCKDTKLTSEKQEQV